MFDATAEKCEAASTTLTSDCNRGGRLQPAVSATKTAAETATTFATEPRHRLPSEGQTRGQFRGTLVMASIHTHIYKYINIHM